MARQSKKAQNWVDEVDATTGRRDNVAAGWSMRGISTERTKAEQRVYTGLTDYFLADLDEGVAHLPQGADRGLLTVAIEHARRNQHMVKLSGVADYIRRENLTQLSGVPATRQDSVLVADQAALNRHFAAKGQPETVLQAWWRIGGYYHD